MLRGITLGGVEGQVLKCVLFWVQLGLINVCDYGWIFRVFLDEASCIVDF